MRQLLQGGGLPAAPTRLEKALWAALVVLFTAAFLVIKLSTPAFDQAQYFRDTASYVQMAEVPLTSANFWAGERPFTLPLFYKLIGIDTQNYQDPAAMSRVAGWQTWISMLSWATLALALAWSMRSRLTAVLAFGFCLAFASIYEIAKWDVLLLSESFSFSLFALLLASWLLLLRLYSAPSRRAARLACLVGAVLVALLYTFVRDSNVYFVVMAALLFAAAALAFKALKPLRWAALAYLACSLVLLAAQNVSISQGNRWQIFIYDHLAYRIIPDPQALAFFESRGLPVSDQLLKIPTLRGAVYQDLMLHSPEMAAVRQWTNAHGKSAYFGYLLSQPIETLLAPLKDAKELLDGTGMDYRLPLAEGSGVPRVLRGLNRLLLLQGPAWAYAAAWLALLAACVLGFVYDRQGAGWPVAAILLLSMYPLMFLVWHGNPMEIPRHADQVAIQFRLAGWLLPLLALDGLLRSHRVTTP